MKIGVVFDQKSFILEAINALEHTAIYGAILAIVIILLFLHSWRTTLIVAVSLPISVLGTLFIAYVCGYSLNIMTLGGLALSVGLIVDDAIVVIENIYRHMALGQSPRNAAESATTEIFSAVLASSVTVVTVFIPLVLIPGLQGLIFTPFAVMVMAAVALSFVVAVTTVPMLSSILIRNKQLSTNGHGNGNGGAHGGGSYTRFARNFDRVLRPFRAVVSRVLERAIARPGLVVGIAALLLVGTIVVTKLGAVKTEIFPASNSVFVRFNLQLPTGTAVSITNEVTRRIENAMLKDPRVLYVGVADRRSRIHRQRHAGHQSSRTSQSSSCRSISGKDAAKYVRDWTSRDQQDSGRTRSVRAHGRHRAKHDLARPGRARRADLRAGHYDALQPRAVHRRSRPLAHPRHSNAAEFGLANVAAGTRHQCRSREGRATRHLDTGDFEHDRYGYLGHDRLVHADQRYTVSDHRAAAAQSASLVAERTLAADPDIESAGVHPPEASQTARRAARSAVRSCRARRISAR